MITVIAWLFDLLGKAAIAAGMAPRMSPFFGDGIMVEDVRCVGDQVFVDWSHR